MDDISNGIAQVAQEENVGIRQHLLDHGANLNTLDIRIEVREIEMSRLRQGRSYDC